VPESIDSSVNAFLRFYRTTRGRRVFNVAVTLMALGLSALAARHFAATGWPLQNANLKLVASAAMLFVVAYPLKALGWRRLFHPSERPEAISLAAANGAACVTGAALPGRFDDAVRIAVVRRYPSCPSGVAALSLSLFMLGLLDAAAIMPISAVAAATSNGSAGVRAGLSFVAAVGLGAGILVALLPRIVASGRLIRFRVARWVHKRTTPMRDARAAWLLVLASWAVRATGLYLLLAAMNISLSFPLAIAFLCAAAASGALPIAPAGAATQAGAGAALLAASGIPTQHAIDFAISSQALLIIAGATVVMFAAAWHAGERLIARRA
jgi:uncharacterized membrane protein YbhN (UPF0104 family)